MLPPEFIAYFRKLIERDPSAEPWFSWWKTHKSEVAKLALPGEYLRLSQTPHLALYGILEAAGHKYPRPRDYAHPKFHQPHPVPAAWLEKRVTLAHVEEKLQSSTREIDLLAIKESMHQEDEVWIFRSPPESWKRLMGRSGFAFVRSGVPYDHIVTMMN